MADNAHAVDLAFDVPKLGNRLHEPLHAMRSVDPIYWSEKNRFWIVTGNAEATEAFRGGLPLSNRRFPDSAAGNGGSQHAVRRLQINRRKNRFDDGEAFMQAKSEFAAR
jgi:hypothetical protein